MRFCGVLFVDCIVMVIYFSIFISSSDVVVW